MPTGVLESMGKRMSIGMAVGRRELKSLLERARGGQRGDIVMGWDVRVPVMDGFYMIMFLVFVLFVKNLLLKTVLLLCCECYCNRNPSC